MCLWDGIYNLQGYSPVPVLNWQKFSIHDHETKGCVMFHQPADVSTAADTVHGGPYIHKPLHDLSLLFLWRENHVHSLELLLHAKFLCGEEAPLGAEADQLEEGSTLQSLWLKE